MIKYIAKPDTWFDAGTEVQLITDCRTLPGWNIGIFLGLRKGEWDEEDCDFNEFETKEVPDVK